MRKSILSLTVAAFCSAPSFADVLFDKPENDYTQEGLSLETGDYTINARNVEFERQLGVNSKANGSLTINAQNFKANSSNEEASAFSSHLNGSDTYYKHNITVENELSLKGTLEFRNDLDKKNLKQDININAKSFVIASNLENQHGILIRTATSGGKKENSAINTKIKADTVKINVENFSAIELEGSNEIYSDTNGVYLKIDSQDTNINGGANHSEYVDNVAIFVSKNAVLELSGSEGANLDIEAKSVVNQTGFGNMSIFADDGAQVNVNYEKNSNLTFNGGLFSMGISDNEKAKISVQTHEGSETSISGSLVAVQGNIDVKTNGNTYIDAPLIMSQKGIINIDIGDEYSTSTYNGIKGNLVASYGNDTYGDSVINVKLSGKNNVFTGTSSIYWNDAKDKNKINLDLRDGASWDVEKLEDGNSGSLNNYLTSLNLMGGGTLNIGYRDASEEFDEFKTVEVDSLSGTDGLISLNLNWTATIEENDKLLVKAGNEGVHTVKVNGSSGSEAPKTSMNGFLIKVDNPNENLNFIGNSQLEQGVYFRDYQLDQRTNADGSKEWFLTYAPNNPPSILTPSAEAVIAFAGMAAQSALYQNQLSDLRLRLGEVRNQNNAGLWTSVSTQREHFDSFNKIGFVQDTYRFNLGFDKKYDNWLLGANVKYHNADQKTNKSNYLAKGNAEDIGLNAYATWQEDGYYLDFVVSADRYHQEIHTNMLDKSNVNGSYHNLGLGLSVEGGRKICFENKLFLEPQAQIGYYHLWGDEFSLSNGMQVKQDNFNSLVSRLGAVFGKDFYGENHEFLGQLYLQAGTRYEALGENSININGYDFEDDSTSWVFYYGVGGELNLQEDFKVYGYVRREEGDGYSKNFDIMLGSKYMF